MGLMAAKRTELTLSRQRCMTGVTKIEDSNALVAKLKVCCVLHPRAGSFALHPRNHSHSPPSHDAQLFCDTLDGVLTTSTAESFPCHRVHVRLSLLLWSRCCW